MDFDPYKSPVADMLPKIERIQKGENEFSEKINNDNFDVKISGGKIFISKNNGKELSIDVSQLPENYIKNTFSKIKASILYDIAESYSLLNIGDGKCAYVICNYFPESLARVKEIMEQNRIFRENN